MDGEQVTTQPSDSEAAGGENPTAAIFKSYKEWFKKLCPQYLAVGMSLSEFWDGEAELATYYREANEHRQRQENYNSWLNGMYFYHALACVSPLYQPFNKHPKAEPYLDAPFPMTKEEAEEQERERERAKAEKFRVQMVAWAESFNQRLKDSKNGELGAGHNQNQDICGHEGCEAEC